MSKLDRPHRSPTQKLSYSQTAKRPIAKHFNFSGVLCITTFDELPAWCWQSRL